MKLEKLKAEIAKLQTKIQGDSQRLEEMRRELEEQERAQIVNAVREMGISLEDLMQLKKSGWTLPYQEREGIEAGTEEEPEELEGQEELNP